MIKYTEEVSPSGTHFIRRIDEDGIDWCIPIDPTNSDYQAYLVEQSTPSVTDETATL
jgi:hypothetical protein